MSCVKPQTLPPVTDREAWQKRREARQRVLAGVRARRAQGRLRRQRQPRAGKSGNLTY